MPPDDEGMGTEGDSGLPLWAVPVWLVVMVALMAVPALVISGCGDSLDTAVRKMNTDCRAHGGVREWHDAELEVTYTCRDGHAGAKRYDR